MMAAARQTIGAGVLAPAIQDIAATAAPAWRYLLVNGETAIPAPPVPMLLLMLTTRVTAAQAMLADGLATQATAITVVPAWVRPSVNIETAKAAQAVQINLPIHTIRAAAEHLTVALTAEIADTVGTVLLMLLHPLAITEAEKTAQLVQINRPALLIQVTAVQAIAARTALQEGIV